MQHKISTTAKAVMLIAAGMLSGCAFVPDTVHPAYKPTAQVARLNNAQDISLSILVKNEKKHLHRVSVTLDGYGIPMASVDMHVKKVFQEAFEKALENRGFHIARNAPEQFQVIVKHFYLKEHQHLLAPSHNGYVKLSVSVTSQGHKFFSNDFTTHTYYEQSGIAFASAGRSKTAQITLNKIVNKVVTDPQVIDAIFRAAGKTPPPDVAGATVPASVATAN